MPPPLHVPTHVGFAALNELSSVPWTQLRHAYGRGVTGDGIHDDVARSLRELGHDPGAAMGDGLYSNICHQGSVYEATAYAVPYIAAIAAGDIESSLRGELVLMLGDIAFAAGVVTDTGTSAGAYGEGVDEQIRMALTSCDVFLRAITAADSELSELVRAIAATAADPTRNSYDALRAALEDEDERDDTL
jgi:hypothetical protein